MKLILKCPECGRRTVIHTKEPIMCKWCKNTKWYCHNCGKYFEPEELCLRCRWFICPYCGACGCTHPYKRRTIKIPKKIITLLFKIGGYSINGKRT